MYEGLRHLINTRYRIFIQKRIRETAIILVASQGHVGPESFR